ncbi:sulfatase [Maribellus sediminis]|uniref:sulfatase family protein n=1 Tax=Maribellus sediminis TaxID=2696285 RepID=UPI001431E155|nr:sulfatase [Maribellus sediminis]
MNKLSSFLLLLLITLSACNQAQKSAQKQPNLLIIFTDEHRRQSMEFWQLPEYKGAINGVSDPVFTPNLNNLAAEGVVFTQAMSTHPVCSPHRAMLLSGTFPMQNGIWKNCHLNSDTDLKEDLACFTDVLYDNGYNTAYFGKCHWIKPTNVFDQDANYVGTTEAPGGEMPNKYDIYIPPGPDRHSVEYWYQVLKDNHFEHYVYSNDPDAVGGKSDGEMYKSMEFSSKHEARTIIDYLKNNRNQRDSDKPFCITWSLNPPHPPYNKLADCEKESYELYENMSHDQLFNRPNRTDKASDLNARVYYANVTSTDKYIGKVIHTLDSLGLGDNTLVVFTSDHGEMLGSHDRMQKNCEYEEAFGVPLIIRYKGVLKHKLDDLLIGTTDLYPTFLGLMGLDHLIPEQVLGTDYSTTIKDDQTGTVDRPVSTPFISIEGNKKGLRTNKYTFTVYGDGTITLFDNLSDPYQQANLEFDMLPAEDQQMLREELGYWLKLSQDPWVSEKLHSNYIDYSVIAEKHL